MRKRTVFAATTLLAVLLLSSCATSQDQFYPAERGNDSQRETEAASQATAGGSKQPTPTEADSLKANIEEMLAIEPLATEPLATEPLATEPLATEPIATEAPVVVQKEDPFAQDAADLRKISFDLPGGSVRPSTPEECRSYLEQLDEAIADDKFLIDVTFANDMYEQEEYQRLRQELRQNGGEDRFSKREQLYEYTKAYLNGVVEELLPLLSFVPAEAIVRPSCSSSITIRIGINEVDMDAFIRLTSYRNIESIRFGQEWEIVEETEAE